MRFYKVGASAALAFLGIKPLTKEAISRLDVELQKGTITPSDVVPGSSSKAAVPGTQGEVSRRAMRERLAAPEFSRSPEELSRLREMRGRLAAAQEARPLEAAGLPLTKQIRIVKEPSQLRTPSYQLGGNPESLGPLAFMRNTRQRGEMFLPENPKDWELAATRRSVPIRSAARLGILQHELGELNEMMSPEVTPYASHMGAEPTIREKLQITGDPALQAEFRALRRGPLSNEDDILFEKLYRQVGGTPDRPIAVGGKQHRALDRALAARASNLSAGAKLTALDSATGRWISDKGTYNVPYVDPSHVQDYNRVADDITNLRKLQAKNFPPTAAASSKLKALSALSPAKQLQMQRIEQRISKKVTPELLKFLGLKRANDFIKMLQFVR